MKKYLILFFGILLSCKEYSVSLDTKPVKTTEYEVSTKLSIEEAQALAIKLRSAINSSDITKSDNLSVLEVVPILKTTTQAHTRSNDECSSDTTVYVVNFADDNGYVILDAEYAADYPVISIVEEGNYNVADPDVNPGVSIVLTNVLASGLCPCRCTCMCPCTGLQCACGDGGLAIDVLCDCSCKCTNGGGGDLGFPDPDEHVDDFDKPIIVPLTYFEYTDWEVLYTSGDLIESKWGQGFPYNTQLDDIEGEKPMTGCVTTAVAQIMSTAKNPPTYNWNLMIKEPSDINVRADLGYLFKEVGDKLETTYGLTESSTNEALIANTLSFYGFGSSAITSYSSATFMDQIDNGKMIYVSGCQYVDETWWGHTLGSWLWVPIYQGRHAWVIDGYIKIKRASIEYNQITHVPVDTIYYEKYLYHYNFGMDGLNDGYYPVDSFDVDDNYGDMGVEDDGIYRTPQGEEGNYQLDVKMMTNIYYKN